MWIRPVVLALAAISSSSLARARDLEGPTFSSSSSSDRANYNAYLVCYENPNYRDVQLDYTPEIFDMLCDGCHTKNS